MKIDEAARLVRAKSLTLRAKPKKTPDKMRVLYLGKNEVFGVAWGWRKKRIKHMREATSNTAR